MTDTIAEETEAHARELALMKARFGLAIALDDTSTSDGAELVIGYLRSIGQALAADMRAGHTPGPGVLHELAYIADVFVAVYLDDDDGAALDEVDNHLIAANLDRDGDGRHGGHEGDT
jgi:hypothetical protein